MSGKIFLFCVIAIYVIVGGVNSSSQIRNNPLGTRLIGEPCEDVSDCVGDLPRVHCSQKLCLCQPGYIHKNDLTDCLQIQNQHGAPCEEPQQCQAGNLGDLSDCTLASNNQKQCSCLESAVSDNLNTVCLPKATHVEDPCQIHTQCLANLGPSSCLSGRCQCLSTAVPSSNGNRCLFKKFIGEFCTESVECTHLYPVPVNCHLVDPADPDLGSKCLCNPGFIDVGLDKCYRLATVIGESCDEHERQCISLDEAKCIDESCTCDRNTHVVSQNRRRCLFKRDNLDEECEQQDQCMVNNSECTREGQCKCKAGQYIESRVDPGKCVEIINEVDMECSEDVQCTSGKLGAHSECAGNAPKTCQCTSNALIIPGAPEPKCYERVNQVGDPCEVNIQCHLKLEDLSRCNILEGKCECIDGAIPSSTNEKCIVGPVKVGESCIEHSQCPGAQTRGQCINNECRCLNGFTASIRLDDCLPILDELGVECIEPQQCQDGVPGPWSDCIQAGNNPLKTCQCSRLGVVDPQAPDQHYCHRKADIVGDSCNVAVQCSAGLGLSDCIDNRCECIGTATPSDDRRSCVLKRYLGEECTYQYECTHIPFSASCQLVNPSRPEEGLVCACNVGFINVPGNNNACYRLADRVEGSCEYDQRQCLALDHTVCTTDQKCLCGTNYVASLDKSKCLEKLAGLNSPCLESQQCQVQHSTCRGTCICAPGFVESMDNPGTCVEIVSGVDQRCQEDVQCAAGSLGEGSECYNGLCKCKQGYGHYDSYCYKGSPLDGRCDVDVNCIIGVNEYSFCNQTDHRCSCKDNAIAFQGSCYRKASELGESCDIDRQCTINLGSYTECGGGGDKRCVCTPGAIPDNDRRRCLPGNVRIGDPCQISSQCIAYPDRSQCTSGICSCVDGFVGSGNRMDCLEIQDRIDGPCLEDKQCQSGAPGNFSSCSEDNECKCRSEAIQEPGDHRCLRKAVLVGDPCEINLQCTENLELSHCFSGTSCRCDDDATENRGKTKCILKRYLNQECHDEEECSHIQDSASCLPANPSESDPDGIRICRCNTGYLNPPTADNACYKLATVVGDTCHRDPIQCNSIENSTCNEGNKMCSCLTNTHVPSADRRKCLPKVEDLHGPCEVSEQCTVENSQCLPMASGGQRMCQCRQGYVESERSRNKCLQVLDNVNLPCEENVQCRAGLGENSECLSSNSTCRCTSGHGYYNGHCYNSAGLGDLCRSEEECIVGVNNFTECDTNGKCSCLAGAISYDNSCHRRLRIGEKCSSDTVCSLSINGKVFCDDVCSCFLSTPDYSGYTCSGMRSAINVVVFLGLVVYSCMNYVI